MCVCVNFSNVTIIILPQEGHQPLHMAAMYGQIGIVEYLVSECKVPIEPVAMV